MAYPAPQRPMIGEPDADDSGKFTHAEVHYGLAKQGGGRCDGCKFYEGPNDCELVQPPIAPAAWCEKFQAAGMSASRNGAAAQPADLPAAAAPQAPVSQDPRSRDPVMAHGRAIAGARALHAVGHITPDERDQHIGKSQAAIRKSGPRKPFGSFSP